MLKKICGLFLGLVVLAGSACVTPTHASSASNVILTRIQAAGGSGAKEEIVVLHNNTAGEIDVTNWCLTNKSQVEFACLTPPTGQVVRYILPSYASVAVASLDYATTFSRPSGFYPFTYQVTSQSSGSMVGSSDIITLYDASGRVSDSKSWTTAVASNQMRSRVVTSSSPLVYSDTGSAVDWVTEPIQGPPESSLEVRVIEDATDDPPIDDHASTPKTDSPINEPTAAVHSLVITELLPNPSGSDTGKEFIELYNAGTVPLSLDSYRLRVGFDTPKWYTFPAEITLNPGVYIVFSDTDLDLTFSNTSGRVQLFVGEIAIGDPVEYSNAKDDQAWASIQGVWQYTKQLTPGAENQPTTSASTDDIHDESSSEPKPCATNQYRSSETNRCRLLQTASAGPTACKEGQERNPETNRCRNTVKMSDAQYAVKGVQTQAATQVSWYVWVAIGAIILGILGYAVWEWRSELKILYGFIRDKFAKRSH